MEKGRLDLTMLSGTIPIVGRHARWDRTRHTQSIGVFRVWRRRRPTQGRSIFSGVFHLRIIFHTIPYHYTPAYHFPCHTIPYHYTPAYHLPCHTIPYHYTPVCAAHCAYSARLNGTPILLDSMGPVLYYYSSQAPPNYDPVPSFDENYDDPFQPRAHARATVFDTVETGAPPRPAKPSSTTPFARRLWPQTFRVFRFSFL